MSSRAASSLLRSTSLKRVALSSTTAAACLRSSIPSASHVANCCPQSASASTSTATTSAATVGCRYLNTSAPQLREAPAPGSVVAGERVVENKDHSKGLKTDWKEKGDVAFDEMLKITKDPGEIVILDVREPAEIAEGNIPFSLPLPLSVLPDAITTPLEEWESKFGFKKPRRDQPIVVYCRSGRRSTSAMEMMQEADVDRRFTNIRNYKGSWLDWVQKYEVEQQKKNDEDDD